MRVLVCGSREGWRRVDYVELVKRLAQLPTGTIVLHGIARGPDRLAGAVAEAFGMEVETYPADWHRHGRRAGIVRNIEMLDTRPNLVIAMWNGTSRGTKHTMDEAEKRGIPVEVIP